MRCLIVVSVKVDADGFCLSVSLVCKCPRVQRAAVRKLQHELGIPPQQLPLSGFRFLTRLHYCAPDTGTYGPEAEWGEHEVLPPSRHPHVRCLACNHLMH